MASKAGKTTGKIELKNVGPIEKLEIDAKPGTVIVLRGPNGAGKSTALTAMNRLMGGGGKVSKRDGALNGSISGGGALLKVTSSGAGKSSGKLEFEPVDEELTVADVVDPGVKDPIAADRKRVEAVCSLLGVEPELERFQAAVEQFELEVEEIASDETRNAGNVVEMAKRLKRDFDGQARVVEASSESLQERLVVLKAAVDRVDFSVPSDAAELEQEYLESHKRLQELEAAQKEALRAESKLQELGEPQDLSVEDALQAAQTAGNRLTAAESLAAELRSELKAALDAIAREKAAVELAKQAVETAQQADKLKAARAEFERVAQSAPSEEELQAAKAAVAGAIAARDAGVLARKAKEQAVEIEQVEAKLESIAERARALREAGKSVVSSLGSLLGGTGLTVDDDGRLLVKHRIRGYVPFAELSDGERWETAIGIVVRSRANVPHGVFVLPQAAWQDLDASARAAIVRSIEGTNLTILTAEAAGEKGAAIEVVEARAGEPVPAGA